jgi:PKD repeat protein
VADVSGPYSGVVNVAVPFDGSDSTDADGSIVSYEWQFGDNEVGSGVTTSHIYTTSGPFRVVLIVTDDDGLGDANGGLVSIGTGNLPPVADAGAPVSETVGVDASFDGSGSSDPDGTIATYAWVFGDNSAIDTTSGAMPSHPYATASLYNVTLTVTDDDGLPSSDGTLALIDVPAQDPVADAGGPYFSGVDDTIEFDGTHSIDVDGDIVNYSWDFDDGSPLGSGSTPTHAYATSGFYRPRLTVTDDDGLTDDNVTSAFVGEGNLPPDADAAGPVFGAVGDPVAFDGSGSTDVDGSIVSYEWQFGDGDTGNGVKPTHTYMLADNYTVTLTVTDDTGKISSDDEVALILPAGSGPESMVDLMIGTIGVSPDPAAVDASLTYTVPITNGGPDDEWSAGAVIVVPANTAFGSASGSQGSCSESSGIVICNLGAIASGASTDVTVTVTAPSAGASLTLVAAVNGQAEDSDTSNNAGSVTSNAVPIITVQGKAKGAGAFGAVGLLLLALTAGLLRVVRVRRTSLGVLLSAGILCGLLLGLPNTSQAQDTDWYGGLGGGTSSADYDAASFPPDMAALGHTVSNVNIDDGGTGWKIFGGYNFNEYFAAELAYVDLGEVSASFDVVTNDVSQMFVDAAGLLPVSGDGYSVSLLGRYPLGERGAIFAKVGGYFWEADLDVSATGNVIGSGSSSIDGTDVGYGIGGDYNFSGNFGLRLEWERYALDKNDVDFLSASLLYRF